MCRQTCFAALVPVLGLWTPVRSEEPCGTFAVPVDCAVGGHPYHAAVGDLDGDLDHDLAVANSYDDTISVLLNDGQGTMAQFASCVSLGTPYHVAAADLDGDLDVDLVAANDSTDRISVMLNNGDATFQDAVYYETLSSTPRYVAAGDLDGDFDVDLAVANRSGHRISLHLNNGDGTFTYGGFSGTGGTHPNCVAMGDVDGDTDRDLVIALGGSASISVLLNNGNGTFAPWVLYNACTGPRILRLGDLDGDLDLDAAVACFGSAGVGVLLNNGDGTFNAPTLYPAPGAGGLALGDFDHDLDLDLASTAYNSDLVFVLPGFGNGTFGSAVQYYTGDGPHSVEAGDLDNDDLLDLVVVNAWDNSAAVFMNRCGGQPTYGVWRDDVVLGLNNPNGLWTLELVRGEPVTHGGTRMSDPWDEGGIQSVEFDNLHGVSHNNYGNLLGVDFGAAATGGSIYSFPTCTATDPDQLIGDTIGTGGDGLTMSRLGGLSVSPDNTMIAVSGFDSTEVILFDYQAGDCTGAGAALSNARQTSGAPLFAADSQGTAWLDNDTVLAFSSEGEIFQVDAGTMQITPCAVVPTNPGGGPAFTDIEYNPAVSPNIYAMYSSFVDGITTNQLFVLDTECTVLGQWNYSVSMDTSREIAFDSEGNLFVSQFGSAVDVIPGAGDILNLADNNSIGWYTSSIVSGFSGLDVANAMACPADLNGDAAVSSADLALLLGDWGPNPNSPADLDGDEVVNSQDLALLLGAWGPC